jgi:hypothetical protein
MRTGSQGEDWLNCESVVEKSFSVRKLVSILRPEKVKWPQLS